MVLGQKGLRSAVARSHFSRHTSHVQATPQGPKGLGGCFSLEAKLRGWLGAVVSRETKVNFRHLPGLPWILSACLGELTSDLGMNELWCPSNLLFKSAVHLLFTGSFKIFGTLPPLIQPLASFFFEAWFGIWFCGRFRPLASQSSARARSKDNIRRRLSQLLERLEATARPWAFAFGAFLHFAVGQY